MPVQQLLHPANPYAVACMHDYTGDPEEGFLSANMVSRLVDMSSKFQVQVIPNHLAPRAGSGIVRTDLLHILAGCHKRPLNPSVVYLSTIYIALLFIRAPLYTTLVFIAMCPVLWLFGLSCQYLPSDC